MFHAVASPYRERSHFDGQDVLENGSLQAHALQIGWLNRALAQLPGRVPREAGVALGQNVPLVMRGPAEVTSWSPTQADALDEDTLARITDLYAARQAALGAPRGCHPRRTPWWRARRGMGHDRPVANRCGGGAGG